MQLFICATTCDFLIFPKSKLVYCLYSFSHKMADEDHEMCSYASYKTGGIVGSDKDTTESSLPPRYRTRQNQPRGGKRRKTTLVKRQKTLERLRSFEFDPDEEQEDVPPRAPKFAEGDERYRIASEDSSLSSVDENYEVDSIASSIEESLTWRGRMQVSLHSHWIHAVIIALVVADAVIVIFELLLDVGAFGNLECEGETLFEQKEYCHYRDHDSCGPPAMLILERLNISSSPGSGVGMDGLCTCKFRLGKRVCDDKESSTGVNPAFVLHIASLFILSLFVIEILLKLLAFRLKYFTHKFEVFDGIIVFLSYILDWASLQEEKAFEAASLVIILRLWRVVRIVNGAVLSAKSRSDQQLSEARLKARKIIHAYHKTQDKMDGLEEENKRLKREVALGKAVRIPRGHYGTQSQIPPVAPNSGVEKDQFEVNGTPPQETKDMQPQPTSMPEIVVTGPPI